MAVLIQKRILDRHNPEPKVGKSPRDNSGLLKGRITARTRWPKLLCDADYENTGKQKAAKKKDPPSVGQDKLREWRPSQRQVTGKNLQSRMEEKKKKRKSPSKLKSTDRAALTNDGAEGKKKRARIQRLRGQMRPLFDRWGYKPERKKPIQRKIPEKKKKKSIRMLVKGSKAGKKILLKWGKPERKQIDVGKEG